MEKYFRLFMSIALPIIASMLGGGVMLAASGNFVDIENGGKGIAQREKFDAQGNVTERSRQYNNDGIETASAERDPNYADPDFLLDAIDESVLKIKPMSTPIEQISRTGKTRQINSEIAKYYSVGTRPIKTTLTVAVAKQTSGDRIQIQVADPNMFTADDTIRVVGVMGVNGEGGKPYEAGKKQELMLKVIGVNEETGYLSVYAVNGENDENNQPIRVPAIEAGKTLVRMGKACSELDVQTGRFASVPKSTEQYCQNYSLQIEMSKFAQAWNKEVEWGLSDLEELGVYDFKMNREASGLFGVKNVIRHGSKGNHDTFTTEGIWWMAGKDIELGHLNDKGEVEINEADLINLSKLAFLGVASSGQKILFAGSDLVAAISNIKSERFRAKEIVTVD
ncbi:MAG: hypothetical protein HUK08_02190, partial [Bacteroidaceae bacterium]|nr:hypothetical protein [Bacteroidaceae bacterium]